MVKPLDAEAAHAARLMIQKLVDLARSMQDGPKLAMALHTLGHSHLLSKELDEAERAFDESREVSGRIGDARGAAISLAMLGFVDILRGRLEDGLPRVFSGVHGIPADDAGARVAIFTRLAHVSKDFERDRFDAAIEAAGRGKPELVDEANKALAAVRS